jgi:hypothetical protein
MRAPVSECVLTWENAGNAVTAIKESRTRLTVHSTLGSELTYVSQAPDIWRKAPF